MQLLFNTSMPRSGSELFQVIAHQNPLIYGSPTSPLLEYQFAARANYTLPEVKSQDPQLMQQAFVSMCGSMAQGYYSAITDRSYVLDKNRGWSHYHEWVQQWCPNPKMVCMVRDLRSVFASFERIYRKNRHSPEGPDNPTQIANMTTAERIEYWSTTQPVGLSLQRTIDCFQRNVAKDILFIRYEDLCNRPQETMDTFYRYVGLPSFTHDFDNLVKEVHEDDSHFGIFGQHQVKAKLRHSEPGIWSDVLSVELANAIFNTHRWFFNTFSYDS